MTDITASIDHQFPYKMGPKVLGLRFMHANSKLSRGNIIDGIQIPVTKTTAFVESIPVDVRVRFLADIQKVNGRSGRSSVAEYVKRLQHTDPVLHRYGMYTMGSFYVSAATYRRLQQIELSNNIEDMITLLSESTNPMNVIDWYMVIRRNSKILSSRQYRVGDNVPDTEVLSMQTKVWFTEIVQNRKRMLLTTGYETTKY